MTSTWVFTRYTVYLTLVGSILALASCADIRFQISPYAPRGVDVVYSAQEDITFFVWRLEGHITPSRVSFELFENGEYRPIDLLAAPFAAEPFDCDRLYLCFQYQVPGKWEVPDRPPLRALDRKLGVFDSSAARYREVETTFDIDPFPVENNSRARPELFDYFREAEIPIKREFQWTLSSRQDENCTFFGPPWSTLQSRVTLPQEWTKTPHCFLVQPRHREDNGARVARPLLPGAVLYTERLDIPLPLKGHHTFVAFLGDTQILNRGRCETIFSTIETTVLDAFEEARAPYTNLGLFRPLDPNGEEASGCDQDADETYPLFELFSEVTTEQALRGDEVVFLLVYLNNVELPPSNQKIEDTIDFFETFEDMEEIELITWSIGSNLINFSFPWNVTTPWMPIETRDFSDVLEAAVTYRFPYQSHDLLMGSDLELPKPNQSSGPEYFKVCLTNPDLEAIRTNRLYSFNLLRRAFPWPEQDNPILTFDFVPRRFIPFAEMPRYRFTGIFDFCDDYCDSTFEGPDRARYPSWINSEGVCQWR